MHVRTCRSVPFISLKQRISSTFKLRFILSNAAGEVHCVSYRFVEETGHEPAIDFMSLNLHNVIETIIASVSMILKPTPARAFIIANPESFIDLVHGVLADIRGDKHTTLNSPKTLFFAKPNTFVYKGFIAFNFVSSAITKSTVSMCGRSTRFKVEFIIIRP